MITLIAACARNGAIGRAGAIPWHAPEDLAFFKRETLGGAVIMGRVTWQSLPLRPLPGRENYIISHDITQGDLVFGSVSDALAHARAQGHHRIYGIGGARIYAALMDQAHRLLLTRVDLDVHDADTFFPDFDPTGWQRLQTTPLRRAQPACVVEEYLRR